MSSQKRKLEEYHDPDYLTLHTNQSAPYSGAENPAKKSKSSATLTSEERLRKVREIIQREFGTELMAKEKEIDEIERRLADAKQLLAKVRYAVVYNYYTRKNLVYSAFDLKAMDGAATTTATADTTSAESREDAPSTSMPGSLGPEPEKLQPAIHPSLKKLLGKRPIDYNELLKVRPVRQAAKTATKNFNKPKKSTKIETTKSVSAEVNTTIASQEEDDSSEASLAPSEKVSELDFELGSDSFNFISFFCAENTAIRCSKCRVGQTYRTSEFGEGSKSVSTFDCCWKYLEIHW